jgi:PKD repeat protein
MDAGTGGSVAPAGGWDNSGAVVPISATANGGYFFSNWTGSGAGSYSGAVDSTSVTMNGPITETADFTTNVPADISVIVQPNPTGASFTVDGSNFTTSQTFSWIPGASHTIATTSPQNAGAGTQNLWSGWSDGGAISHTVNPTLGTTYTANFTTQFYLTMTTVTGGAVSPNSGWENSNTVVPISATANSGYAFSNWTGTGNGSYSGNVNSTTVTMNGPISETVSFTLGPGAASSFTMSSNIGVAPFTVTFADTSLNSPTSWLWTFGDGGASTNQNPSHTFTNIWRQTVTLTVSNAYGGSTSSQNVYQCFPCDAVYDWTNGIQGHVATSATLAGSLVGGSVSLGAFALTNYDLPSPNLQGVIFTNLPGMTNGCPVVFSNGVIYSNFNTTNALAYTYTNNHEQYNLNFYNTFAFTNMVWLFYASMPSVTNSGFIDENWMGGTTPANGIEGPLTRNCWVGYNGVNPGSSGEPQGSYNDYNTLECTSPTNTVYGGLNGISNIYQIPNKLYRILMQEDTNGNCVLAVGDPISNSVVGFVTNHNYWEQGQYFNWLAAGHVSGENFTYPATSILQYHVVLSFNRPLTFSQISNVVMYGP